MTSSAPILTPDDIKNLKVASTTDQLMVVIPKATEVSDAYFYMYIKDEEGNWNEFINTRAYIGKNGIGKEKEGDNKTPIGLYNFTKFFGIADNPGASVPYIKANETLYWNGDSNSDRYNQMVSTDHYTDFDTAESEHIIDYTKAYQYCMHISYNYEGIPHLGSAIFLHCFSNNPYTAGCVAISEDNMKRILQTVNENCKIIIDELENVYKY